MHKDPDWRLKVQEIFQICQDELKRTTQIGKKMLTASKTNTSLHESYEQLGRLVAKAIERGELEWNNQKALELLGMIKACEKDLKNLERDMNRIKFSSAPLDVSKDKKEEKNKR